MSPPRRLTSPRYPLVLSALGFVLATGSSLGSAAAAETSKAAPQAAQAKAPAKAPLRIEAEPRRVTDASSKPAASAQPAPATPAPPAATPASAAQGAPATEKAPKASAAVAAPTAPVKPAYQKTKVPKVPAPVLPEGAPLTEPDDAARRAIANGPSADQIAEGPEDEQLAQLRDAEAVLFPKTVRGIRPGWSWDLPEPREDGEAARGIGLPLTPQAGPEPSGAQPSAEWLRSLTMPDLPVRLDRRVVTYLEFYRDSERGRAIAAIWAKKSGRYVAAMKAEFRRAGLPTDLVWLSLIESGHNPTIKSPVGAMGLWQFMAPSARMYGLTVDRWVDERRDPARSTQAAVRFLQDLYQRFGSWELAMGAYNMGYAGMSRAIRKYNTNDYWTLSRLEGGIPWETTLYVPKIFALAIVMNNREAFGLDKIPEDPTVSFDTILVAPATPLEDVAKAAEVSVSDLRDLNFSFVADRTPPVEASSSAQRFAVKVPRGKGERALSRLGKTQKAEKLGSYRIKFGDTLTDIAAELGSDEPTLQRLNALEKNEKLEQGSVLVAPGARGVLPRASEVVVVAVDVAPTTKSRRVFYRVRDTDSLAEISEAFGVSVRELSNWNALDEGARLGEGMVLQILVPKDSALADVRHLEDGQARALLAGSAEFHEHFEGLEGRKRVQVVVGRGDTLWSIGQRYGMSVGSMERINRRSRDTKLVPGEILVVYTDRNVSGVDRRLAAEDLPKVVAPQPDALPNLPGTGSPAASASSEGVDEAKTSVQ